MVEEGEPVDESPADGEIDSSVSADTEVVEQPVESDNEVVSESRADPPLEVPAESLAAAAIRNNWGPVADPLEPGPGNPSPDGTTLAFLQSHPTSETRLWFYAIDGSSRRSMGLPFTPVVDDEGPQWSPDGLWLAMTGSHYPGGPTSIWLAPIDGGECVVVARHEGSDRQPRWSPDGSLIAFVSNRTIETPSAWRCRPAMGRSFS